MKTEWGSRYQIIWGEEEKCSAKLGVHLYGQRSHLGHQILKSQLGLAFREVHSLADTVKLHAACWHHLLTPPAQPGCLLSGHTLRGGRLHLPPSSIIDTEGQVHSFLWGAIQYHGGLYKSDASQSSVLIPSSMVSARDTRAPDENHCLAPHCDLVLHDSC